MRVLITGIHGFVGGYLAEYLSTMPGIHIFGASRAFAGQNRSAMKNRKIRFFLCDVRDSLRVRKLLKEIKPDRIFHLAGQSIVSHSWKDPADTLAANTLGAINLFEGIKELGLKTRVHVAGSALEYGPVKSRNLPIKETCPLQPGSPYAVSKVLQDQLAMQYHQCFGLWVVRTRAFNHIGPGQKDAFVASNFAKQIALIEAGKQKPVICVGELGDVRDFTDVRDMARAYWLALDKGKAGEVYNIASGQGVTIKKVLDFFLSRCAVKVRVKKEAKRLFLKGTPALVGDAGKFQKKTGWKPIFTLEATLLDLLNDWRRKIAANNNVFFL